MLIYLIRHGITMANEQRLYCGSTDLPLSQCGIEGIMGLKDRGEYPPGADRYYTSGLARADQTLELIFGPVKSTAVPELAEFDFGAFEMRSYDELKDLRDYQAWITDETGDVPCPGGESGNRFKARVMEGFERIVSRGGTAFAVCHGGVIVSIMDNLFPGQRNFYEWQPEPGRGYALTRAEGRFHIYKP